MQVGRIALLALLGLVAGIVLAVLVAEEAEGVTFVTTDVTTDTTWTLANSPYRLTKDVVYVNKGVALTIESGVEV